MIASKRISGLLVSTFIFTTCAVTAAPRARAEPAGIARNMYIQGNLRIAVTCAGELVTPEGGLRVTIVGNDAPLTPLHLNKEFADTVDENGNAMTVTWVTDVGFLAPPGPHRLRLEAPDCAAEERDVDISPSHATTIAGTMSITTTSLLGPVGAPDGVGLLLGLIRSTVPRSIANGTATGPLGIADYSFDPSMLTGGVISVSGEHRNAVYALDTTFAYGSLTGQSFPAKGGGPYALTGWMLEYGLTFRIGARLPLHDFTLMAGSGIGGSLWLRDSKLATPGVDGERASTPMVPGLAWHVPLWAGATFKPGCNWGVQVMASYGVTPTNFDANTTTLTAGLLFQPSSACNDPTEVSVSP